ncbi:MAG: VIT domain-containing protein, partial [Colwellia sp.]|nr:VIT domain-containing protein [Colwellia sp.]
MFISKNNRQLIDYQNSYYCRQQRKKRRYKWLKLSIILLLIMSLALFLVPFAQSNQLDFEQQTKRDNALIHGPQLLFENPNKSLNQSPNLAMRATFPVDIEANIEINGLVAYAEIKQTFINPHAIALSGKYQFPLPENSAVKQLIIKIGDKEIIGEIMEKKAAKARYQKAKKQGKKASLVEQHRPNLFTNTIANIPAQSTVVVTLKFIMPVSFSNGKFNLRLPLA